MKSPRSNFLSDLDQSERFEVLIDAVKDYAIYLLDPDGFALCFQWSVQKRV